MSTESSVTRTRHPLDQLSADEISQAVAILREDPRFPSRAFFRVVAIKEPSRAEVREFEESGAAPARRAYLSIFDRDQGHALDAVVDLDDDVLLSLNPVDERLQPGITPAEQAAVHERVRADRRWQDAMRARGVDDFAQVAFETGPAGQVGPPFRDRRRLGRTLTFLRPAGTLNYYAYPVQGLVALVDLLAEEVLDVIDEGVVPIPTAPHEFHGSIPTSRPPLREIQITQPAGTSFTVTDGLVEWQNWSLRVGIDPIDGLVLHRVGYRDGDRLRPVLHRASLAELVVPYGDPSANQHWRNSFDAGEAGIGRKTTPLRLGCDCLGEIQYIDAVVADFDGVPRTIENAVCIHEEDFNVGWKHFYEAEGVAEVRRSRRLVVSSWATLGNYDYGFAWHLYTDGRIELEVKLTGIVFTGAAVAPPRFGALVAPGLYAPHHQHIFCVRLDPEIDGPDNSVVEMDVLPEPSTLGDTHGIAFRPYLTVLEREGDAVRDLDASRARSWVILNEAGRNAAGSQPGFKLAPRASATMLATPDSFVARAAGFARHSLWVTANDPNERHPAGEFPAYGDRGLPDWVKANRIVRDTEIVVWHCFATTHAPRPEDWPVMPVEYAGFELKPFGFFDRSPALDLPRPGEAVCHQPDERHQNGE